MKNKAFTLIEVLVVVLIIGILTSIAVVQYQKSVLKSRFTALMPIAKALYEGNELFAMSSGKYTDKLENLDMSTTGGASGSTANINGSIVTLGVNDRHSYVKATRENFDNNLIMFQKGSRYFPGEIHCEAKEGKTLANWLCQKELGGEKLDRSLTEGYNDYVINGDGNGVFPIDWVDVTEQTLNNGDTCTSTVSGGCYHLTCYNCEVEANNDYAGTDSKFTNSVCEGNGNYTCRTSTFTNSTCIGNASSCRGINTSRDQRPSTFINSICIGNHSQSCVGNIFRGNSVCYANVEGACGDIAGSWSTGVEARASVYEGNACCSGEFCPGYAPKCDCPIDSNTGQHALSC